MERPRNSLMRARQASSAVGRRHRPDNWLFILTGGLLGFGLIVVYSISPGLAASQHLSQGFFVTKQILAVGMATIAFFVASRIPLETWKILTRWLVWLAIIGSIVVLVTPVNQNYPAHRWVRLGGFSFQIAELIKLALVMATAQFLTERWRHGQLKDSQKTLYPLVGVLAVLGIVVAKMQSDLGSAGVMVVVMGIMAYVVGMPVKKVLAIGGLIILLGAMAVSTSGYRRERLNTFLHPGSDCTAAGYQACQALISVGSGGLVGLGLGYSVQAYGYLPEASNDSIYAIISEKFGFIGSFLTLVLYGVLLNRLRRIAERTAGQFERLVVVGVIAWIGTQMIINVGAMIGLLPLKGITLPLVSQGGTSIVFLAAALGLIYQISRYTSYQVVEPAGNNEQTNTNNRADGRWDGRTPSSITFSRPRN